MAPNYGIISSSFRLCYFSKKPGAKVVVYLRQIVNERIGAFTSRIFKTRIFPSTASYSCSYLVEGSLSLFTSTRNSTWQVLLKRFCRASARNNAFRSESISLHPDEGRPHIRATSEPHIRAMFYLIKSAELLEILLLSSTQAINV
jgi:hypothetical protein